MSAKGDKGDKHHLCAKGDKGDKHHLCAKGDKGDKHHLCAVCALYSILGGLLCSDK